MSTTFTPIEVPMTVSASTEAVRTSLRSGIPYVANGITDPDTKSAGDVLQYNGSAWVASDELTDLKEDIGDLDDLETTDKSNLVAAINEAAQSGGGGGGGSVSPYTSNPAALGTASPGSSANYSRGDHVHPKPTAADIGAISAPSSPATGAFLVWNGSAWVAQTLSTWQGGEY